MVEAAETADERGFAWRGLKKRRFGKGRALAVRTVGVVGYRYWASAAHMVACSVRMLPEQTIAVLSVCFELSLARTRRAEIVGGTRYY